MFDELIVKIANELNKQHIPYMIIGGQTVLLYGEPRLTKDIDITLGIGLNELNLIKNTAKKLKLEFIPDDIDKFVKRTYVFPAVDKKTGIRVDFIFSFSSYEKQAIIGSKKIKIGKTFVRFASKEDVIIHKIIAGRARDIEDIKSIILKNPDYDRKYTMKWLRKFDKSLSEKYTESFKNLIKNI